MALDSISSNSNLLLNSAQAVQAAEYTELRSGQRRREQQRETVQTVEAERYDPDQRYSTTKEHLDAYAQAREELGLGDGPATPGKATGVSAYQATASQERRAEFESALGVSVYA
ncbi:MAG: hypothetical protein K6A65_08465 [Succinivibrionaceae bacterium]|nr:hypothetical protein [Succinivibrionaceae bacterium]